MTDEKKAYLAKLLQGKRETLWAGEAELAFSKEYFADRLEPGAMEKSREDLAEARKNNIDPDEIAKLNERVEDIKDSNRVVERLTQTLVDLEAQIKFLEKLTA